MRRKTLKHMSSHHHANLLFLLWSPHLSQVQFQISNVPRSGALISHSSHPAHNHDDEDGDSHDGNNNGIRTNTESYARHGFTCFYTGLHVNSPIIGTYYPYFTEGKQVM